MENKLDIVTIRIVGKHFFGLSIRSLIVASVVTSKGETGENIKRSGQGSHLH